MSDKVKTVLKSTLIVSFISVLIALTVKALGGNFLIIFLLAFLCQYILFSFVANIISLFLSHQRLKKELDVLEPLSTILECAYCNHPNVMTFVADDLETSEFLCSACGKKNSVKIQFVVARQTEIISLPNSTIIEQYEK